MKIQYSVKDYIKVGSKVILDITEDNIRYMHEVNLDVKGSSNPNWIDLYGNKIFTVERMNLVDTGCSVKCVRVEEHWTIPEICLKKVK